MAKIDRKASREMAYAERSRVAIANMVYKDCPPPFISVVGPRSSGKTTLVNSVVGHYWKERGMLQGPVTMKVGHKRFTLYESTGTIENVIDTIKVSDMIILLVSLDVGLQKETLETLTMINSQGVPKLCFVLTHHEDRLSKSAKEIARRIQKEFSHPVKLFHVSKEEDGTYDVGRLVRYLEAMKYRPVEWKCTHPHIVADRIWEGFVYGYIRGGPVSTDFDAHVPGHGNRRISGVELLEDPCSLGTRSNALYNPMGMSEDQPSSSADTFEMDSPEIKLFDEEDAGNFVLDGDKQMPLGESSEDITDDSVVESVADSEGGEDTPTDSSDFSKLDCLKNELRGKFMGTGADDPEERFIREYREKEKSLDLQAEKRKQLESKDRLGQDMGMAVPGSYVRVRLDVEHDLADLLVIGACLPTENAGVLLKGTVRKNRWQRGDLKSNAPFFFSMGWFRFQSIPMFTQADKALKYCKVHSEIVFYGPSVPVGTSFFMFSLDSYYRILGTGQVLDASGEVSIRKKLKLLGYPRTIMGNSVIVQSMFSSSREADKFVNAKLSTASGLRGLLKSSVGKDGCFRSTFEGPPLKSDVVFLKCFVPMRPYHFIKHMTPGQSFVRSLREIKEEMGLPLFEESISEESEDSDARCRSKSPREVRDARELKALERELPFDQRSIREVKETVELPIPPEQRHAPERSGDLKEGHKLAEDAEASRRQKLEARRRKDAEAMKDRAERKRSAILECIKKKHKKRRR